MKNKELINEEPSEMCASDEVKEKDIRKIQKELMKEIKSLKATEHNDTNMTEDVDGWIRDYSLKDFE